MATFVFEETTSDVVCPPYGIYTLEITKVNPMVEKPALKFKEDDADATNTQNSIEFTIRDFDYDPEQDERDWNGFSFLDFFTWAREYHDSGRKTQVWRAENSKAYPLVAAILGRAPQKGDSITIDESLVGTRIQATIDKTKKGYPTVKNPAPVRKRSRPAVQQQEDTSMVLTSILLTWMQHGLGGKDALDEFATNHSGKTPEQMNLQEATDFLEHLQTMETPNF